MTNGLIAFSINPQSAMHHVGCMAALNHIGFRAKALNHIGFRAKALNLTWFRAHSSPFLPSSHCGGRKRLGESDSSKANQHLDQLTQGKTDHIGV